MKNLNSILWLLPFFLLSQFSLAQEYKDCNTAYTPCGESSFHIDISAGLGFPDSDVQSSCIAGELNSSWIKWTVMQAGSLIFTLSPDSTDQDLDFTIYKYNTNDDCTDKELIRCMASGQNVGQDSSTWIACTGPTGLAFGETDLEEFGGCAVSDNNFLAPIEANTGDQYVLLVNNFSPLIEDIGFTLSFGGSAVLDCIPVPIIETKDFANASFELRPTLSNGVIFLELADEKLIGVQLMVYDMLGRLVYSEDSVDQLSQQIVLNGFTNGTYILVLNKGKTVGMERFFVLK